ncbi:MAG: ABC transporter ATP-binding protein [Verrucomicrobiales bacterium]|jgi:ABC-2 type transport system ATP-binding protein|nr:ABC transporter ATP-binding protein [Verrucomicrobiales bacterium]|tara:strand:+ start:9769 stop:10719 length:951 start_codon:yes stop_codon:yes gene_type:complete
MVEVTGLHKHFGNKVAVDGVSFTVKKGEVLGFLGPNGAGKSTTLRMVTGYFPPTQGTVSIDGANIERNEIDAKAKIGYLPEAAPLYSDMTVEGFLRFAGEMRGIPTADLDTAVDKAIKTTFLEPVRHQSVDTLSKGYRHRTCFAQSIIHDPEVLILDEPTDGLDPNQKHEVRQLISRMGKEKAILFSTHILEEVEAACTRAIIIDRGQVIADGTPDELKARSANAGSVRLKANGLAGSGIQAELEKLPAAREVQVITSKDDGIEARILPAKGNSGQLGRQVSGVCQDKNLSVEELHVEEGRLDELFREITKTDSED